MHEAALQAFGAADRHGIDIAGGIRYRIRYGQFGVIWRNGKTSCPGKSIGRDINS